MVIFMETDLEKSKPFDESKLSDIQKQVFQQLGATQQEKIRAGYRAIVCNFEDDFKCEFNDEGYVLPKSAIEGLARSLLPLVREYYSKEENRRAFEEWKKEQGK